MHSNSEKKWKNYLDEVNQLMILQNIERKQHIKDDEISFSKPKQNPFDFPNIFDQVKEQQIKNERQEIYSDKRISEAFSPRLMQQIVLNIQNFNNVEDQILVKKMKFYKSRIQNVYKIMFNQIVEASSFADINFPPNIMELQKAKIFYFFETIKYLSFEFEVEKHKDYE